MIFRKLAQSIHSHKPLDKDWKDMSVNLKRLAEIVFDESTVCDNNGNNNNNHNKIESTLWDNVNDKDKSNASINLSVVRLLLEEGKLNLLLRLLTNFKSIESRDDFKVAMESECNRNKIRMGSLMQLCTIYEQSLGILLFFCIQRIESLQILDCEHLVGYIANILNKKNTVFRNSEERMNSFYIHLFSNDKRQEILVIYYLYILSTYFHKLGYEEKLMALIEKYQIISKSVAYIMKYHKILSFDVIQKYILFLSNCFQTETFSAEPEIFIFDEQDKNDKSTIKFLCELYDEYVNKFMKQDKVLSMKQCRGYMKQYQKLKKML